MANEAHVTRTLSFAAAAMITSALADALLVMTKELRRYAGKDFHRCLDALETDTINIIENAPIDGIAEVDQLMLVQQTRGYIIGLFETARSNGIK